MKLFHLISFILAASVCMSQPNCEVYKSEGNIQLYEACKEAEERAGHYQFSRAYQEALDEALQIDSSFSWAYRFKSTAYLKSGDFLTWKALMDKAVEISPAEHLDYRSWCRFQFFRDYRGAIRDIERLDSLVNHDIGYSVNGDYHLQIARALCYYQLNETEKAIKIIEEHLKHGDAFLGLYDYLHLGAMYLKVGDLDKAMQAFYRQQSENDLADNRYYLAICHKLMGDAKLFEKELLSAKTKFLNGHHLFDPYTERVDQVYLDDIMNALNSYSNERID